MTGTSTKHTDVPSVYPPSEEFAAQANATEDMYREAEADRLAFWAKQAERLSWDTPFTEVLDWSEAPFAKWFVGGKLNVAYNCVDRHVEAGNGDRVAIHWQGEPVDDTRDISYAQLQADVCKAANAFTDLGLVAGDRVAIYMPMLPEAIVSMLACARLGIMHSVVFAGFSATALAARIEDAEAKLVITSDGQFRRGQAVSLKEAVDEACKGQKSVEHVLVVRRTGIDTPWTEGRDLWWQDTVETASPEHTPEAFDSEHPLFLLYTSGTTGKPKGIMHTSGGYLTQTSFTHYNVFDLKPETDVYWCTADIGWVTGHTYIVYGPLSNGATQVVYEGTPASPNEHRHFEIIEKYGVTIYYTAPTLVRMFMKWGREFPDAHDLSSLRLLGSVGEPINPEAWRWYRDAFGGNRTPIVDTWWQTETGAIMISPLPGVTEAKPGSAMQPLPGISAMIVDEEGNELVPGADEAEHVTGYLVLDQPWPSMLRGIWGDPERYKETYWSRYGKQGWYFAGDGARVDSDGFDLAAGPHRRCDEHFGTPDLDDRGRVGAGRSLRGRRGGRRRGHRRNNRSGHLRVRHPRIACQAPRRRRDGRRTSRAGRQRRSARSPGRGRSTSCPNCRKRAAARSCADCCAMSPRVVNSVTRQLWWIPACLRRSAPATVRAPGWRR